jgi:phage terminase Nu1 subunit (DNA packaging protein)
MSDEELTIDATPQRIRTRQDCADILGITRQTLSEWRSRGCKLKQPNGDYDLEGIRAWRAENIRPVNGGSASSDVAAARARAINAQAAVLELKLRRASGELISSHESHQVIASQVLLVRKLLEDLPERLVVRIATQNEAERLRVRSVCAEMMASVIDAWHTGIQELIQLSEAEKRAFVGSEEFQKELPDAYKWPKKSAKPKVAATKKKQTKSTKKPVAEAK